MLKTMVQGVPAGFLNDFLPTSDSDFAVGREFRATTLPFLVAPNYSGGSSQDANYANAGRSPKA